MAESKVATTYPTEEQYSRWQDEADEFGMSTSEFIKSMTEAGLKKFERHVETDEDANELRQQRNELRDELKESRERIQTLEQQLYDDEKAEVEKFIRENPGSTFSETVQHVLDTVQPRVSRHLTELEGDDIYVENELYYPMEGQQ